MFRQRPLTWLFVLATIAVDLVLMTIERPRGPWRAFTFGLILGQMAALAIWAVRGNMHRLARAGCLVGAMGLLMQATYVQGGRTSPWLAFCAGYVFLIMLATLVSDLLRYRLSVGPAAQSPRERWQVPLVEFFGWTIVVAILSFAARHMDFHSLLRVENVVMIVALLAVPMLMTCFLGWLDRRASRTIILAFGLLVAGICLLGEAGGYAGGYVVFVQTAYLIVWIAVLGMDNVLSRMGSPAASSPEEDLPAAMPRLLDPHD